ncbi:unnamed protein product [Cylicocyclus nassatus]|uniref:Uncharacterized protein n=1 Tax=Cylicocyclus nassatus TaxID=53992 RepID=A0AA36DU50_CYLNA|nr:unnamed protein product [Cylicocyclus nassatus]
MKLRLVTCKFCDRLYSCHSLPLHEPKCQENPNARIHTEEVGTKKLKSTRPRTQSLSRSDGVEYRICFVCGKSFDEDEVAKHERRCLKDYKQECERLDKRFVSRPPEPLTIPTVDGTYDAHRLNEHAKQQAEKAQLLRCRKCYAKVALREADDHNCGRFDPPVEFYF